MTAQAIELARSCERTHVHTAHEWAHGRHNYTCTGRPMDDARPKLWGPWATHAARCSCAVCR